MGEIVQIWIKRFKRGRMDAMEEADLVEGLGRVGNANQGGRRQVPIIDEASWNDATIELGLHVDPAARHANVMLRGVDLRESRGRLVKLGDCIVRILGETRPCDQIDDAQPGLRSALKPAWRGCLRRDREGRADPGSAMTRGSSRKARAKKRGRVRLQRKVSRQGT